MPTKNINFNLSVEEHAKLLKVAKKQGETLSRVMRDTVRALLWAHGELGADEYGSRTLHDLAARAAARGAFKFNTVSGLAPYYRDEPEAPEDPYDRLR